MKTSSIANCYIAPNLSNEQFIPSHTFMYVVKGTMTVFDGHKKYDVKPGDFGIARRNHLARYTKHPDANGAFNKIYVSFEQQFLKEFNTSYKHVAGQMESSDAVIPISKNTLVENFIQSLILLYKEYGTIEEPLLNVKRTELLLLLLKTEPDLAHVFFDFSEPGKIDLEKFMIANFRFNVSIERFAYLTGRSLSAFKRDFEKTFHASPSHWLVKKRLEEAYYLMDKKNKKPSEIYLDLGFEDLSHFSFAFKKLFGHSPTELNKTKKTNL